MVILAFNIHNCRYFWEYIDELCIVNQYYNLMFCKIKQSTVLILGQMEMNTKVDIFLPRPTYIGKKLFIKKHTIHILLLTVLFLLSFKVRPKVNSLESRLWIFFFFLSLNIIIRKNDFFPFKFWPKNVPRCHLIKFKASFLGWRFVH